MRSLAGHALGATVLVSLTSCTGAIIDGGPGGPEDCPADNGAPETPSITSPEDGVQGVLADELTLSSSDFSDAEGDSPLESQWEIWQVAGGAAVQRVWSATIDDLARLTRVSLADGVFEVGSALELDKSYQVQTRHRSAAGCSSWSAWSAPGRFGTDDGSAYFFADSEIRDLYLSIPQASYDAINAQANPPGCVPYERTSYAASMTFEGEVFDQIGLKTKGGCGSTRDLGGKASWKINLEWDDEAVPGCPAERKLLGQTHLTLNNNVQDASFVHQQLAYHFYRLMGVAAPRANYVRVHVNDQPWGLYTNLETADRRMLGRWFDSNDGMMYEGTYFCDLLPANVPTLDDPDVDTGTCIGREFVANACSTPAADGDPTDYSLIRALTEEIAALPPGEFYPAIDQMFDFDTFLSMWAVDATINHWDGFVYDIMNNYRVYHDPGTDRWSVIPSGTDQTFTTSRDRSAFTVNNVVARRCLEEDDCKAAFVARLQQALATMQSADLAGLATTLRDRIAADVMADPRKEFGYDTFVGSVDATIGFINGRAATVQADLTANGF